MAVDRRAGDAEHVGDLLHGVLALVVKPLGNFRLARRKTRPASSAILKDRSTRVSNGVGCGSSGWACRVGLVMMASAPQAVCWTPGFVTESSAPRFTCSEGSRRRARSSVGEHSPYKRGVAGSKPAAPTNLTSSDTTYKIDRVAVDGNADSNGVHDNRLSSLPSASRIASRFVCE